nr:AraC family transcriptional regulator [Qipengyuania sphaerica]
MRLIVHGSFRVVSIYFTPGATLDLDLPPVEAIIDRILPFDCFTKDSTPHEAYAPQDDVRAWLSSCEERLLAEIEGAGLSKPHDLLGSFETLCLADPGASLDEFAERHGLTRRTLERTIKRDFGVTPRFAMRRARALDMAAALLNVASKDEEAAITLRYFDQSHVTREMHQLLDTTPGRLKKGDHPLLSITMEIRQSRRLEMLERLESGGPRPWRDPEAEPQRSGDPA